MTQEHYPSLSTTSSSSSSPLVNNVVDVETKSATMPFTVRRLVSSPATEAFGVLDARDVTTTPNNGSVTIGANATATTVDDATSATGWYRDPITGRLTNQSKDDKNVTAADSAAAVEFFDMVPSTNGSPVVTYQQTTPFYPIRYSCEDVVSADAVGNNGQVRSTTNAGGSGIDNDKSSNNNKYDAEGFNVVEMSVAIDFEFLLPTDIDDVNGNVDALQWSILKSLAERLGLSRRCDLTRQFVYEDYGIITTTNINNHSNLRRRRHLDENRLQRRRFLDEGNESGNVDNNRNNVVGFLPYPTSVYAIGTNPSVEWTDTCDEDILVSSESDTNCFTMQAVVDVVYHGSPDEENIVKNFIKSVLQTKLETNPDELYVKNVEDIHMVTSNKQKVPDQDSQQNVSGKQDAPAITHTTTSETERRGVAMYVIIPTISVFIILLFVGWASRQNKKKRLMTGSPRGKMDSLDINIQAASSETTDSSMSPTNVKEESEDLDAACMAPRPAPKSLEVDTDCETGTGLPPRPPRKSSTNLKKKRRKKKKKKKVVALKRVNSRENISEMPTISESWSEGDDDSEFDSEDSGDDDDGSSSYDTSSGCVTPLGSLSRSSSRASSPKLSPVRDSDENNKSFVIEAPDFPHLLRNAFAMNATKASTPVARTDRDLPPLPPLAKRVTNPSIFIGEINEKNSSKQNDTTSSHLNAAALQTSGSDLSEEIDRPGGGMFFLPWLK